MLYAFVGTPDERVTVGRDMLFLKAFVEPHDEAFWEKPRKNTVTWARSIEEHVHRLGGRLLLVVVPNRVRIYPEQVPEVDFGSSPKKLYYGDFMRDLAEAGVEAVDLESVYSEYRRRYPRGVCR